MIRMAALIKPRLWVRLPLLPILLIIFYMGAMSSCAAIKVQDIKPYKIVWFLTLDGRFCIPESATSKKMLCKTSAELAVDPTWKDHGMLVHDQNMAETINELLQKIKDYTLVIQGKGDAAK